MRIPFHWHHAILGAILISFCAVNVGLTQNTALETMQRALEIYSQAQNSTEREARLAGFREAERLFQRSTEQGLRNANLYANLGTAALQSEHIGHAVLSFRRALSLDPDHPRARQNLIHTRGLLPPWVPRPQQDTVLDSFFFWRGSMSSGERAGTAGVSFLVAALGFAVAIRWRNILVRNLAIVPALIWVGLITSIITDLMSGDRPEAVIVVEETIARAADSINAPVRFAEPLPGGTEVVWLDARDQWVKIGLSNGRDAWVRRTSLALIDKGL